jgi:FLVCR family feline leukemia virus subgroup C receptor-related protein
MVHHRACKQTYHLSLKRATATAILSIINTVGVGIGFLIPGLVVDEEGNYLRKLFLIEAIGMTVPILATIIFIQNNPPSPPSYAAAVEKTHFMIALKELFQNKSYIITFFAYSIVFGSFNTIATLIQ